tara:strand:- start:19 stop:519 length:501 start_codon:yes stop_codon:yes gene_type:complete
MTTTITGALGIDNIKAATGSVLQVVHGSYGSSVDSTSNTYADTGLTLNITPSSTSSKVLVIVSHPEVGRIGSSAPSNTRLAIKLMRDSTDLTVMSSHTLDHVMSAQLSAGAGWIAMAGPSVTYLDSPSSTSALTYKTQFRNATGNTNGVRILGDAPSKITLMEIAG